MDRELKKISTSVPKSLLDEATKITGFNQTQVIIQGLREVVAKAKRENLLSLKGKISISFDADSSRNRKKT